VPHPGPLVERMWHGPPAPCLSVLRYRIPETSFRPRLLPEHFPLPPQLDPFLVQFQPRPPGAPPAAAGQISSLRSARLRRSARRLQGICPLTQIAGTLTNPELVISGIKEAVNPVPRPDRSLSGGRLGL
jgi:hypothetical protein